MYCPTSKGCQRCQALEALKLIDMPNGTKRRRCDACGRGIPPYSLMQGAGFLAETVDHHWVESDGNSNFHMPVNLELCYPCYMADYARNYPDAQPPEIKNVRDFEAVLDAPRLPVQLPDGYFQVFA